MAPTVESPLLQPGRVEGIDLLRGISIILVVLTHIGQSLSLETSDLSPWIPAFVMSAIFWSGYLAVAIFFVISGFLITSTSLSV